MKKYSLHIVTAPRILPLALVFMFAAPYCLLSQSLHSITSKEEANEIVIEETGIYPVAKDIFDTTTADPQNNSVVYGYTDDVKSFWYKIYVTVDSKITFEIYPTNPGNRYNYFLYQHSGDLNINEVYTKGVAPVRANLYEDKMENGTGLSLSSSVSSNDSFPLDINKTWYHTPYQSAVTANAGDVLLLNIYHVEGTDCGQHFILQDNKHVQEFQSIYETCYNEGFVMKKIENSSGVDFLAATGKRKSLFVKRDSTRESTMEGETTCLIQCKAVDSTIHPGTINSYEVVIANTTTPDSLSQTSQLTASINSNPRIKIKYKNEIKKAETPYVNKEEAGLVTAGMFSNNTMKLAGSKENNSTENGSEITGIIIGTSISGFIFLILLIAILDKKNRKEHSNQVV